MLSVKLWAFLSVFDLVYHFFFVLIYGLFNRLAFIFDKFSIVGTIWLCCLTATKLRYLVCKLQCYMLLFLLTEWTQKANSDFYGQIGDISTQF